MTTLSDHAEPITWATGVLRDAGIEEARFEAQLLFALALGVSRTAVIARTYAAPTAEQWRRIEALVESRSKRVPLAHLRGTQEFYGLQFVVSPEVLIPRPETELLVDFAIEHANAPALTGSLQAPSEPGVVAPAGARGVLPWYFADIGTGSGCVAVAVLAHCERATAIASDISPGALRAARNNAMLNGVSNRIRLVRASLLAAARTHRFDALLANPPYIPTDDIDQLQPEVRDHEPGVALNGGSDGLDCYRRIAADATRALRPGGWIAVEVGAGQAGSVTRIFETNGIQAVGTRLDLAGIERLVYGQCPSQHPSAAGTGYVSLAPSWRVSHGDDRL